MKHEVKEALASIHKEKAEEEALEYLVNWIIQERKSDKLKIHEQCASLNAIQKIAKSSKNPSSALEAIVNLTEEEL